MNIEPRLDAYAEGPKRPTDGPTAHVNKCRAKLLLCYSHGLGKALPFTPSLKPSGPISFPVVLKSNPRFCLSTQLLLNVFLFLTLKDIGQAKRVSVFCS